MTSAGSLFAALFSALTVVVLIKSYSPHEWGVVAGVTATSAIGALVLDWGSSRRLTRDLSAGLVDTAATRQALRTRLLVGSGVALVGGAASLLVPPEYQSLAAAICVTAAGRFVVIGMQAPLYSLHRFSVVAVLTVVDKLVGLMVVLAWVRLGDPPLALWAVAQALGVLVTLALTWIALGRNWMRLFGGSWLPPRRLWAGAASFGTSAVVGSLVALDVTVVNVVAGSEQGGIFAVGSRLAGPLGLLGGALSAVALPMLAANPYLRLSQRSRRLAAIGVAVAVVAAVALVVWGPAIVVGFLGPDFTSSLVPVRLYVCAAVLNTAAQLLVGMLQARGNERYVAHALATTIALSLGLTATGAWLLGAGGASAGFLTANAVLLVLLLDRVRRTSRPPACAAV